MISTSNCRGALFDSVPPQVELEKCAAYFSKEANIAPEQSYPLLRRGAGGEASQRRRLWRRKRVVIQAGELILRKTDVIFNIQCSMLNAQVKHPEIGWSCGPLVRRPSGGVCEALGMACEKSLVGICFKFDRGWSKTTPRRLTIWGAGLQKEGENFQSSIFNAQCSSGAAWKLDGSTEYNGKYFTGIGRVFDNHT